MTRIHVLPIADLIEHTDDPDCVCGPDQDTEAPSLYVHHSLDGREKEEKSHG